MSFVRRFGIPILGIVIVLIGIAIYAESLTPSFGRTAYAPLVSTTFVPNPSPNPVIGVIAIVLGVALVLGVTGFRAAHRRPDAGAIRRFWPIVVGILLLVVVAVDVAYTTQTYAWMAGEAVVGSPEAYRETALSFLTGVELGGAIRVILLAIALGCVAMWVGGVVGRRRATR